MARLSSSKSGPMAPGSEDQYLLQVSEKRIYLVGATPRAALYATYRLLERLGCGWCVPGDDSVPKRATLAISPVKVDTAPALRYRMMLDFPLMSVAQIRRDGLDILVECADGGVDGADPSVVSRITLKNACLYALWCS